MTFRLFTMTVAASLALGVATESVAQPASPTDPATTNPFLQTWNTPFGVPDWNAISLDHIREAFDLALTQYDQEIAAIAGSSEAPTIENTLVALERSGRLLDRVSGIFYPLLSAHSNDDMQALAREMAPRLAANSDNILLNQDLFNRIDALYQRRDGLGLDAETLRLLEETHRRFARGGIALPEAQKERLRAINGELSQLTQRFGQNQLAETNAYALFLNEDQLDGLSAGQISAAAAEARRRGQEGKYAFTLAWPSLFPFLSASPHRDLREQIFHAHANKANNNNEQDNKAILSRMAALRAERAQLLGSPTHAHFVLSETMAMTPDRVMQFLDQLWAPAIARATAEAADLERLLRADGFSGPLQPWDWWYYSEKLRTERYALDEDAIRAYFPLPVVLQGAFDLSERLWGITFHERTDLPVYHEDVQAWEVREADGTHLGVFYTDFYTRPSKRGGAWMTSTRRQSNLDGFVTPIVHNVCNFPPPQGDAPSLLSLEEVTTLFHELGHALHGLFSSVRYPSLSGTAVSRDFVEFPSQIMENWVGEPEYLISLARHYQTGEPIPQALVEQIRAAALHNEGFRTVEYLAASYLDMAWHTLTEPVEHEAEAFEQAEMDRIGLISSIIPRYRSTYFGHIFSGGYSAGYYSYIWAAVLDADGFEAFRQEGLFNRTLAQRLRDEVLSRGNTLPSMTQYVNFRGQEPDVAPLLRRRGLDGVN